ncbi:hypothetical protein INR49_018602 [Caranx melampygus]|nr:hypothetical protein INR49_018602 [Caranx melampygus]
MLQDVYEKMVKLLHVVHGRFDPDQFLEENQWEGQVDNVVVVKSQATQNTKQESSLIQLSENDCQIQRPPHDAGVFLKKGAHASYNPVDGPGTGLRAAGGPNCPLELSPQQHSCTMSPPGPDPNNAVESGQDVTQLLLLNLLSGQSIAKLRPLSGI